MVTRKLLSTVKIADKKFLEQKKQLQNLVTSKL